VDLILFDTGHMAWDIQRTGPGVERISPLDIFLCNPFLAM
jgi:hypothetical protein